MVKMKSTNYIYIFYPVIYLKGEQINVIQFEIFAPSTQSTKLEYKNMILPFYGSSHWSKYFAMLKMTSGF